MRKIRKGGESSLSCLSANEINIVNLQLNEVTWQT